MSRETERREQSEVWIAWVRLAAVPFAAVEVGIFSKGYPAGHELWAWLAAGALALGAVVFFQLARTELGPRTRALTGVLALAFDTAIVAAFIFIFAFEEGTPVRQLVFFPLIEGALRYGLRGGLVLPIVQTPVLALFELYRISRFSLESYDVDHVTFPVGLMFLMGLIVGWLVDRLRLETSVAETRAAEAEELRNQIGRRADQLEAVNRCARALSSTLDQAEAFRRFLREAQTAFRFDRLAIVLAHGSNAEVIENAGHGEEQVLPAGTIVPAAGTAVGDVVAHGRTIVRNDMAEPPQYREDVELVRFGLRSRIAAPLVTSGRAFGILSVSREEVSAFSDDEVDLITLLGRQVAAAVENIRAYEAERSAAEELRRLSALRADFVSLVSHELRAPMASVIGCAATLRQRWRALTPEQRESFLALIEEETSRLAGLVGDVLDTSRMDAGSFSYAFAEVDLAELVRETAAVASLGQTDIAVRADVAGPLPPVRADRDRIRQVLLNLLGNAVKYTVPGDEIDLSAAAENGRVEITVRDHGPGIPAEEQRLIFEKFGRASVASGASKPGAGLGLFIARSIAEAHGGSLEVESEPGEGAAFVLSLPGGTL